MEEHSLKIYKYLSLLFLAVIVALAIIIYLLTYIYQNMTCKNQLIFWAVENHLPITIILITFSGLIGYIFSTIIYKQLTKTKKDSQKLLEMLFLFLNNEEKEIISWLVQKGGTAAQVDISRLPNMNRVKAFRSLQKMQQKNLIDITEHGKVRNISLKENILNLLIK